MGGKLLQLLLIAEQLGAGRVEDAAIHPLRLHQAAQIVQQVGEGYGGRAGAHPLGRHHHGQVEHQIPHHLEGGGAGPYDDAGPQLHRGHPRLPKQLAAVATGVEVAAVAGDRLYGPQIDDTAHPGGAGGGGEVLHPLLLQPVKTGASPHGVHQIEDGIHPGKGRQQGDGLEAVGETKLHPLRQAAGAAGPGDDPVAQPLQMGDQIGTYVTRRTHHQTVSHSNTPCHPPWTRTTIGQSGAIQNASQ